MTSIDSEIIRKAVEHNYKKEVIDMSETLRKKIKDIGHEKTLYLNPEIDGDVLGVDDNEIIDVMSDRLIKYKIKEKVFEELMFEGLIKPINICEDSVSINKHFETLEGTDIKGKFGFRRMIYDEFMTA